MGPRDGGEDPALAQLLEHREREVAVRFTGARVGHQFQTREQPGAADVAHRANRKNIRLMERALADRPVGAPVPAPTVGYVASALLLVAVPLLLALVLGVVALVLLVGLLI